MNNESAGGLSHRAAKQQSMDAKVERLRAARRTEKEKAVATKLRFEAQGAEGAAPQLSVRRHVAAALRNRSPDPAVGTANRSESVTSITLPHNDGDDDSYAVWQTPRTADRLRGGWGKAPPFPISREDGAVDTPINDYSDTNNHVVSSSILAAARYKVTGERPRPSASVVGEVFPDGSRYILADELSERLQAPTDSFYQQTAPASPYRQRYPPPIIPRSRSRSPNDPQNQSNYNGQHHTPRFILTGPSSNVAPQYSSRPQAAQGGVSDAAKRAQENALQQHRDSRNVNYSPTHFTDGVVKGSSTFQVGDEPSGICRSLHRAVDEDEDERDNGDTVGDQTTLDYNDHEDDDGEQSSKTIAERWYEQQQSRFANNNISRSNPNLVNTPRNHHQPVDDTSNSTNARWKLLPENGHNGIGGESEGADYTRPKGPPSVDDRAAAKINADKLQRVRSLNEHHAKVRGSRDVLFFGEESARREVAEIEVGERQGVEGWIGDALEGLGCQRARSVEVSEVDALAPPLPSSSSPPTPPPSQQQPLQSSSPASTSNQQKRTVGAATVTRANAAKFLSLELLESEGRHAILMEYITSNGYPTSLPTPIEDMSPRRRSSATAMPIMVSILPQLLQQLHSQHAAAQQEERENIVAQHTAAAKTLKDTHSQEMKEMKEQIEDLEEAIKGCVSRQEARDRSKKVASAVIDHYRRLFMGDGLTTTRPASPSLTPSANPNAAPPKSAIRARSATTLPGDGAALPLTPQRARSATATSSSTPNFNNTTTNEATASPSSSTPSDVTSTPPTTSTDITSSYHTRVLLYYYARWVLRSQRRVCNGLVKEISLLTQRNLSLENMTSAQDKVMREFVEKQVRQDGEAHEVEIGRAKAHQAALQEVEVAKEAIKDRINRLSLQREWLTGCVASLSQEQELRDVFSSWAWRAHASLRNNLKTEVAEGKKQLALAEELVESQRVHRAQLEDGHTDALQAEKSRAAKLEEEVADLKNTIEQPNNSKHIPTAHDNTTLTPETTNHKPPTQDAVQKPLSQLLEERRLRQEEEERLEDERHRAKVERARRKGNQDAFGPLPPHPQQQQQSSSTEHNQPRSPLITSDELESMLSEIEAARKYNGALKAMLLQERRSCAHQHDELEAHKQVIRESTEAYAELLSHSELWFQQLYYLKLFCDIRRIKVPVELLSDPTSTLALEEEQQRQLRLMEGEERAMLHTSLGMDASHHNHNRSASSPRSPAISLSPIRGGGGRGGYLQSARKGASGSLQRPVAPGTAAPSPAREEVRRHSNATVQHTSHPITSGGHLHHPLDEDLPTPLQDLAKRPLSPDGPTPTATAITSPQNESTASPDDCMGVEKAPATHLASRQASKPKSAAVSDHHQHNRSHYGGDEEPSPPKELSIVTSHIATSASFTPSPSNTPALPSPPITSASSTKIPTLNLKKAIRLDAGEDAGGVNDDGEDGGAELTEKRGSSAGLGLTSDTLSRIPPSAEYQQASRVRHTGSSYDSDEDAL